MCTIFIVAVHRIVVGGVTNRLLKCTGLIVTVNLILLATCTGLSFEVGCDSFEES